MLKAKEIEQVYFGHAHECTCGCSGVFYTSKSEIKEALEKIGPTSISRWKTCSMSGNWELSAGNADWEDVCYIDSINVKEGDPLRWIIEPK